MWGEGEKHHYFSKKAPLESVFGNEDHFLLDSQESGSFLLLKAHEVKFGSLKWNRFLESRNIAKNAANMDDKCRENL